MSEVIRLIFDGPPGPEAGRFGRSNKETPASFNTSPNTVEAYPVRMMEKYDIPSQTGAEIAVWATPKGYP